MTTKILGSEIYVSILRYRKYSSLLEAKQLVASGR